MRTLFDYSACSTGAFAKSTTVAQVILDLRSSLNELKFDALLADIYIREQHPYEIQKGIDMRSFSFCGGIKPSMNPDTVDSLYTQQVKKKLTAILDSMDEMQRRVLEMRLGLIDGREMTVEEVAAELGEELLKVQQWEDQALRIMHHPELAWNKDED